MKPRCKSGLFLLLRFTKGGVLVKTLGGRSFRKAITVQQFTLVLPSAISFGCPFAALPDIRDGARITAKRMSLQ